MEPASLDRVLFQLQQGFNLVGSHARLREAYHAQNVRKYSDMDVRVYLPLPGASDCRAVPKQFLDSHGIAYTEINVDLDPAASAEVIRHVGKRAIPQMVINGQWFQPYSSLGKACLYEELRKRRLGIGSSSGSVPPRTSKVTIGAESDLDRTLHTPRDGAYLD